MTSFKPFQPHKGLKPVIRSIATLDDRPTDSVLPFRDDELTFKNDNSAMTGDFLLMLIDALRQFRAQSSNEISVTNNTSVISNNIRNIINNYKNTITTGGSQQLNVLLNRISSAFSANELPAAESTERMITELLQHSNSFSHSDRRTAPSTGDIVRYSDNIHNTRVLIDAIKKNAEISEFSFLNTESYGNVSLAEIYRTIEKQASAEIGKSSETYVENSNVHASLSDYTDFHTDRYLTLAKTISEIIQRNTEIPQHYGRDITLPTRTQERYDTDIHTSATQLIYTDNYTESTVYDSKTHDTNISHVHKSSVSDNLIHISENANTAFSISNILRDLNISHNKGGFVSTDISAADMRSFRNISYSNSVYNENTTRSAGANISHSFSDISSVIHNRISRADTAYNSTAYTANTELTHITQDIDRQTYSTSSASFRSDSRTDIHSFTGAADITKLLTHITQSTYNEIRKAVPTAAYDIQRNAYSTFMQQQTDIKQQLFSSVNIINNKNRRRRRKAENVQFSANTFTFMLTNTDNTEQNEFRTSKTTLRTTFNTSNISHTTRSYNTELITEAYSLLKEKLIQSASETEKLLLQSLERNSESTSFNDNKTFLKQLKESASLILKKEINVSELFFSQHTSERSAEKQMKERFAEKYSISARSFSELHDMIYRHDNEKELHHNTSEERLYSFTDRIFSHKEINSNSTDTVRKASIYTLTQSIPSIMQHILNSTSDNTITSDMHTDTTHLSNNNELNIFRSISELQVSSIIHRSFPNTVRAAYATNYTALTNGYTDIISQQADRNTVLNTDNSSMIYLNGTAITYESDGLTYSRSAAFTNAPTDSIQKELTETVSEHRTDNVIVTEEQNLINNEQTLKNYIKNELESYFSEEKNTAHNTTIFNNSSIEMICDKVIIELEHRLKTESRLNGR